MSTLEGTTMHPWCSHIGACWDLLKWFQALWHKSKFNLELLKRKSKFKFEFFKIKFLCFHVVVLFKTFPLMYLLLMYNWYWWGYSDFSSSSKVKIRISNFFEKKIRIFGFPCCSTHEDLSIDVSITTVGLILTKLRLF